SPATRPRTGGPRTAASSSASASSRRRTIGGGVLDEETPPPIERFEALPDATEWRASSDVGASPSPPSLIPVRGTVAADHGCRRISDQSPGGEVTQRRGLRAPSLDKQRTK
ncbi:MAG: hypothetical protein LUP91_11580, partial [Methylococcaceae bacterium]|nr:hypothetical protein [Methylococcaceae bacterium]